MASCTPRPDAPRRARNPFPVFPGEPEVRGPMKKSRMGKRRAIVLAAVHVAIILHVVQWKVTGSTLSPVEPSEAMRTLELGELNAGFLFFLAAILSTLLLGRWFCGWGCHIVALQDACGWMMRKLGVRPRPFRSRLLVWAPVVLAFYMFAWPTVKRLVVAPALARLGWEPFREPPPFPGFESHLVTESFWATFPGIAIAVPFLLICGFLAVYLLGSKGFCTYGCPYGGVFGPVDALARGRIRVDPDRCDGCAHCTAVCTSNVRVHEDVREYGMVVDPGCMKCLDCVDTCPTDALRYGFGPPATRKGKPRTGRIHRHWDVSGGAEIALAVVFAASFAAWRGAYGSVPFLMAVGIAACTTFLAWLLVRLALGGDRSTALQGLPLRKGGRLTAAGRVAAPLAAGALLLGLQAGAVQVAQARAERFDREVAVTRGEVFARERPPLASGTREAAERAAAWYRRADSLAHGGLALAAVPEVVSRRAWMALVLGRPDEAEEHLSRMLGGPDDRAVRLDLARTRRSAGRHEEATAGLRALVAEDPADAEAHRELAATRAAAGDLEGAADELAIVVNLAPEDATARRHLVTLLERLGRPDEAARYRR